MRLPKILKRVKDFVTGTGSNAVTSVVLGIPQYYSHSYKTYVEEGYLKNPTLFACLDLIARAVGETKWCLYNGPEETKDRKLIESHPLLDLVRKPDPRISRSEFYARLTLHAYLEGDAFIFKNAPSIGKTSGKPKELNLLRPDRVRMDEKGIFWFMDDMGQERKYLPDTIIQTQFYNPLDDYNGVSPLKALSYSVDVNNAAREWNYSLLQNAIKLSAWFELEGELDKETREIMEEQLKARFAGKSNSGKPMILTAGLTPKQGNFNPHEMDWLNGLTQSENEIMRVLHVPSELMNQSGEKGRTFSNYEIARKSFYTEVVIPFAKHIRDNLNIGLAKHFGDNVYIDIDTSVIKAIQEEIDKKESRVRSNYTSGLLTLDEAREAIGYPALSPDQANGLYQTPVGMTTEPEEDEFEEDEEEYEKSKRNFSPEEKARRRRRYDLVQGYRSRFEKYIQTVVADQFRSEGQQLVYRLKDATTTTLNVLVDQMVDSVFMPQWVDLMTKLYIRVITTIGDQELAELQAGKSMELKKFDPFTDAVQVQVRNVVGKKVQGIGGTSKRIIKRIIGEGVEEGLTVAEIAKNLGEYYETKMSVGRAERIARTEAVSTSNFAGQEVAKQSGLKLKKEWISTLDGNARGSRPEDAFDHEQMDGKREEISAPYNVSGERMMFPGDTSLGATAGNVINCRCAEAYVPIDEE